ncbi:hypothetical protein ACUN9Y_09690 [Halomonas sp. V046]|uniref:hypothetical protein n=1 Tax=Halomonas sp. V046 TaxID=3459611 RepID=UPI004044C416
MKGAIALCAAVMLTGCATSPVPAEQADQVPSERLYGLQNQPKTPHATVQITRDSGVNFSMCNASVHIDGKKVAELEPSETASFYVDPGERVLGITTGGGICANLMQELESSLKEGERKRYRISMDASGSLDLSRTAF